MKRLKKVGEVSEITGIGVREIKYYVEQNLIVPSEKVFQGKKEFWMYSNEDIKKLQQIKLYRELGCKKNVIKEIIQSPDFDWNKALEDQIIQLRNQKNHLENTLLAAESIRFFNDIQEGFGKCDYAFFDNDIDDSVMSLFKTDLVDQSVDQFIESVQGGFSDENIKCLERFFKDMEGVIDYAPDSEEVQNLLDKYIAYLYDLDNSNDSYVYFINFLLYLFRIFNSIGMNRFWYLIFNRSDFNLFFENALEKYRERKENITDGQDNF